MGFTVEPLDLYNRKDVENVIEALSSHWIKVAANQPRFAEEHPLWKHSKAASIGEIMRLARVQIYRNEDWVIRKDGVFVAYALSRAIGRGLYPILLVTPLNWDSQDAADAVKAFIEKWIDEGYRKVWIRFPVKVNLLQKVSIEKVAWKFIQSYPEAADNAPFPAKWDIYEIEVQT